MFKTTNSVEILEKPLIIMTPKSLLRNKLCVSNLEDFEKNKSFHRVLKDHSYTDSENFLSN